MVFTHGFSEIFQNSRSSVVCSNQCFNLGEVVQTLTYGQHS